MATNIRPLHDHVFVRRIAEGEQARGGIIILDTARERSQEGEVVAVGEGEFTAQTASDNSSMSARVTA